MICQEHVDVGWDEDSHSLCICNNMPKGNEGNDKPVTILLVGGFGASGVGCDARSVILS